MLVFGAVQAGADTHSVAAGSSQAVIQAAINAAVAGDIVYLNDGTYTITKALTFKSGITFRGGNNTVLDASGVGSNVSFAPNGLNNITFYKLKFKGIWIKFTGDFAHTTGLNNKVDYCEFFDVVNDKMISFEYCKGGTVSNCKFTRSSSFGGRGINMMKSHNTIISANNISGYFFCGINANGNITSATDAANINHRTYNTDILNNTITRTAGSYTEDHGIYVIGIKDCLIQGNTVSGWTPLETGGAVKLRNGEDVRVLSNTFNGSGVLMYTYDNTFPKYLMDIQVKNNVMNISGNNAVSIYRGVGYWRDFTTGSYLEDDFWIEGNDINNGCINLSWDGITVPQVNGGVNNNSCPLISLKAGILASGNTP